MRTNEVPEKRDQVLQLRLGARERALLDEVAEQMGFTRAQTIRYLFTQEIKRMRDRGQLDEKAEALLERRDPKD